MGFLNIFKPSGPTSHDIVSHVRKVTSVRQVGHSGTLDPLADGVLVVAVGYATRLIEYLANDKKKYRAVACLGYSTNTYDRQGLVTQTSAIPDGLTLDKLVTVCSKFKGTIAQIPPAYSALKVNGRRAYDLARQGTAVELPPRQVTIHDLAIESMNLPEFTLEVTCSAGTYIRSLVHDIGHSLGCGATLIELTRVASGSFEIEQSIQLDVLKESKSDGTWVGFLIGVAKALPAMMQYRLSAAELGRVVHGRSIDAELNDEFVLGIGPDGDPVAVLRRCPGTKQWQPIKVLVHPNQTSRPTN